MRNVRITTAAVAAGFILIAGCERGDAPDDSTIGAPQADSVAVAASDADAACALVEEAAVEAAVGFDVVMNDNSTGNCLLTPASGDPSAPAFDFRIEPRVSAFDYFSGQRDATPIDGLGDRAVWATLNDMTGYVVVVNGGHAIVTAVAEVDGLGPESRRQAEALARLLLAADTAGGAPLTADG